MRNVFLTLLFMPLVSCGQVNKVSTLDVFEQYAYLLDRSSAFIEQEGNKEIFLDSLDKFIKNYKYSRDYSPKDTLYDFNHGRMEAIILPVFLFDSSGNQALTLFLYRTQTISKDRLEIVHFIRAQKIDQHWTFELNNISSLSYSYEGNIATLSDQEITIRVLNVLINDGYFYKGTTDIDNSFFTKDWYNF